MSVRKNITLSDEIASYFEERSKETGISQSALMAMAMAEYIDQKRALNSLGPLMQQLEEVKQLALASQTKASDINDDSIAQS